MKEILRPRRVTRNKVAGMRYDYGVEALK